MTPKRESGRTPVTVASRPSVDARRARREGEGRFKLLTASAFYRLLSRLVSIQIPVDVGDFRLLSRRAADEAVLLAQPAHLVRGLVSWIGFRQTGVEFTRAERLAGETKYPVRKMFKFALDGITASSTWPLRIWTYLGVAVALSAFLYAAVLIGRTMVYGVDVPGYASLMVVVLLFGGINLLTLGIIGEYLGRIYTEVKARPLYLVRDLHGFDAVNDGGPADRASLSEGDKWTAKSTPAWRNLKTGTGGS